MTHYSSYPRKSVVRQLRKPEKRRKMFLPTKKPRGREGRRAMPSTSTKCWSKSTPTPESLRRPWWSWTASWTTFSSASPESHRDWPTTTSGRRSRAGKSRLPYVCFCPESWPSTPCLKAPRLWPSTRARSKLRVEWLPHQIGPFQGHQIFHEKKVVPFLL